MQLLLYVMTIIEVIDNKNYISLSVICVIYYKYINKFRENNIITVYTLQDVAGNTWMTKSEELKRVLAEMQVITRNPTLTGNIRLVDEELYTFIGMEIY